MVAFPLIQKAIYWTCTNCPERVVDVQDMGRLGKSDHCMLCVAIKCRPFTCKDNQVGLNWNRANIPAMRQDLDSTHWREELEIKTVEEGRVFLNLTLEETISMNVPRFDKIQDDAGDSETDTKQKEKVVNS